MSKFTECTVSEINLWDTEKLQTSILERRNIAHYPLNSDNSANLEFLSSGQTNTYRDLSACYIKLKCQFLKENGEKTYKQDGAVEEHSTQPGLISNSLHSLFRSVQILMNNRPVFNHDLYHLRSYIELITNYSTEAIKKI